MSRLENFLKGLVGKKINIFYFKKMNTFLDEEIRVIIKFLWSQGKRPSEILQEIRLSDPCKHVSRVTVYKWFKRFKDGNCDCEDRERSGRPLKKGIREIVAESIEDDPYQSARTLASALHVDKNTVCSILKNELKMKKVNAHWIPHDLTDQQKKVRVDLSGEMLKVLNKVRYSSLILTGDETFLYWKNLRNLMWLQADLPPPSRERHIIGSKKLMISVIWSTSGMKSIDMLPLGQSFNKEFYINTVLADLLKNIQLARPVKKASELRLLIDNARPHLIDDFLKENGLTRLPHPPYSPDLATSDFFLFGYLKMRLEGKFFSSDDELFEVTCNILQDMPHTILYDVFHEWIRRLERCVELKGENVE